MTASRQHVTARSPEVLVDEYLLALGGKAAGTVDAYARILRQLTAWIAARPGSSSFQPEYLTRTALETYLADLAAGGYSVSHRMRVKAVAGGFARWLIEEKELLRRNPARGVEVPAQAVLAPRQLSPDQLCWPLGTSILTAGLGGPQKATLGARRCLRRLASSWLQGAASCVLPSSRVSAALVTVSCTPSIVGC